jgi:hypothetical protein
MVFPFADLDIPAVVGVMTGFGMFVIIPVVAMLLSHQRRMAELVHNQQARQGVENERILRLEQEVSHLREQLTDNILAFDDHREVQHRVGPPPTPRG